MARSKKENVGGLVCWWLVSTALLIYFSVKYAKERSVELITADCTTTAAWVKSSTAYWNASVAPPASAGILKPFLATIKVKYKYRSSAESAIERLGVNETEVCWYYENDLEVAFWSKPTKTSVATLVFFGIFAGLPVVAFLVFGVVLAYHACGKVGRRLTESTRRANERKAAQEATKRAREQLKRDAEAEKRRKEAEQRKKEQLALEEISVSMGVPAPPAVPPPAYDDVIDTNLAFKADDEKKVEEQQELPPFTEPLYEEEPPYVPPANAAAAAAAPAETTTMPMPAKPEEPRSSSGNEGFFDRLFRNPMKR